MVLLRKMLVLPRGIDPPGRSARIRCPRAARLVLGSLIPCALFYFLQLYIKRNRPPPSPTPGSPTAASSATPSGAAAAAVSTIHRTLSRGLLSPRALPALSARGAVARAGDEDSLYYAGLRRCADDPYHPAVNPSGVIQLGLAENHLSLDLVGRWMEEHAGPALTPGGDDEERGLTIRGLFVGAPHLQPWGGGCKSRVYGRCCNGPTNML